MNFIEIKIMRLRERERERESLGVEARDPANTQFDNKDRIIEKICKNKRASKRGKGEKKKEKNGPRKEREWQQEKRAKVR